MECEGGYLNLPSEANLIAMRLGPGKHLKGRSLLGGVVKPEEFDYFHEVYTLLVINAHVAHRDLSNSRYSTQSCLALALVVLSTDFSTASSSPCLPS